MMELCAWRQAQVSRGEIQERKRNTNTRHGNSVVTPIVYCGSYALAPYKCPRDQKYRRLSFLFVYDLYFRAE